VDLQADRRRTGGRQRFFSAVGEDLAECIRLIVRYETKDEAGETRRQRNERFGFADRNPVIEPPEGAEHLLEWFMSLSERRSYGYSGPNPISFMDISAWCSLTGERPSREEVAAILKMDSAFLRASGEERDAQMARMKEAARHG
jgi:hypothetical protein